MVSFCQSDSSFSIQRRAHVIPHTTPGSASQSKVKHPRHQSAVFFLPWHKRVGLLQRGRVQLKQRGDVVAVSHRHQLVLDPLTESTLVGATAVHLRRSARVKVICGGRVGTRGRRKTTGASFALCRECIKLTTGGGSALSPLYPGFSCKSRGKHEHEQLQQATSSRNSRNETGKKNNG